MNNLIHRHTGLMPPSFYPPRTTAAVLDILIVWMLTGSLAACPLMGLLDPAIALIPLVAYVSLITQGLANIAWPNGLLSPIGVSGLLCAVSGAGKSLAMRLLGDPIRAAIEARILEGIANGRVPQFLIEDATREAVIVQLSEWAVAGLFTDETGQLKSLLQNAAPTFAKLIDGSPLPHARVSNGGRRISLKDQRFTMLLMGQPVVFEGQGSLLGRSSGGIGIFNRFFTGRASFAPGLTAAPSLELTTTTRGLWADRAGACVRQTIDLTAAGEARPTLYLDASAEHRFNDVKSEVVELRTDPRLATADEYISRHPERVRRFAGALHVLRHGAAGEVQAETVEAAHQIGLWSIESYAGMIYKAPILKQSEVDAVHVEQWLMQIAYREGPSLNLKLLRRGCQNIGLTQARFNSALTVLAGERKVTICPIGRDDVLYVHAAGYRLPYVIG